MCELDIRQYCHQSIEEVLPINSIVKLFIAVNESAASHTARSTSSRQSVIFLSSQSSYQGLF